MVFHVLNRGVARMQVFEKAGDYRLELQKGSGVFVIDAMGEDSILRVCHESVKGTGES